MKSELLDMTMYVCLPLLVLTIQKVLTLPSWWKMTNEEKKLLQKLASGELDGFVGNNVTTSGGSTVWKAIPAMFKQGPEGKFFNGQENERYEGVLHTLQKWVTDDEVLSRIMRKFICRLRLSEVSRQRRRRPEPPPSASCSCISGCPTGCPPHGGAGHRPASEQSYLLPYLKYKKATSL